MSIDAVSPSTLSRTLAALGAPACRVEDIEWMFSYPAALPFLKAIQSTFSSGPNCVLDSNEIAAFSTLEREGKVLRGERLQLALDALGLGRRNGPGDDGELNKLQRKKRVLSQKLEKRRQYVEALENQKAILMEELNRKEGQRQERKVREHVQSRDKERTSFKGNPSELRALDDLDKSVKGIDSLSQTILSSVEHHMIVSDNVILAYQNSEKSLETALRDKYIITATQNVAKNADDTPQQRTSSEDELRRLIDMVGIAAQQQMIARLRLARASAILQFLRSSSQSKGSATDELRSALHETKSSWDEVLRKTVLPLAYSVAVSRAESDIYLLDRQTKLKRKQDQLEILQQYMLCLSRQRARIILCSEVTRRRALVMRKLIASFQDVERTTSHKKFSDISQKIDSRLPGLQENPVARAIYEISQLLDDIESIPGHKDDLALKPKEKARSVPDILQKVDTLHKRHSKRAAELRNASKKVTCNDTVTLIQMIRKDLAQDGDWLTLKASQELLDLLHQLQETLLKGTVELDALLQSRAKKSAFIKSRTEFDIARRLWIYFATNPVLLRKACESPYSITQR